MEYEGGVEPAPFEINPGAGQQGHAFGVDQDRQVAEVEGVVALLAFRRELDVVAVAGATGLAHRDAHRHRARVAIEKSPHALARRVAEFNLC